MCENNYPHGDIEEPNLKIPVSSINSDQSIKHFILIKRIDPSSAVVCDYIYDDHKGHVFHAAIPPTPTLLCDILADLWPKV
jgi:hypothetical protein